MKSTLDALHVMELMIAGNFENLKNVVNRIPDGNFRNQHTGDLDKCNGFVLLANGYVCPVYRYRQTTLNPLSLNSELKFERISYSMARIIPDSSSIEKTVNNYNEKIYEVYKKNGLCWYDKLIVAYHSIDPDWGE